jgi:hypothetical protein
LREKVDWHGAYVVESPDAFTITEDGGNSLANI